MGSVKKNILITGLPGVGKTTLIKKLSEALKSLHPVGFYTEEIREGEERKGFEMVSLEGRRGLLSHTKIQSPFRVGRYRVDMKTFEDFLSSIPFLSSSTDLIIIDEIGKMECFSKPFQNLLEEILESRKWLIATIAWKGTGLITEVKKREDIRFFKITKGNRESLLAEILKEMDIDTDGRIRKTN